VSCYLDPVRPKSHRPSPPNDRFGLAKAVVAGSADFCVVWEGAVEEAQQFLKNAGVKTFTPNVTGARGPSESVYFRDPDGNLWEFTVYRRWTTK